MQHSMSSDQTIKAHIAWKLVEEQRAPFSVFQLTTVPLGLCRKHMTRAHEEDRQALMACEQSGWHAHQHSLRCLTDSLKLAEVSW